MKIERSLNWSVYCKRRLADFFVKLRLDSIIFLRGSRKMKQHAYLSFPLRHAALTSEDMGQVEGRIV